MRPHVWRCSSALGLQELGSLRWKSQAPVWLVGIPLRWLLSPGLPANNALQLSSLSSGSVVAPLQKNSEASGDFDVTNADFFARGGGFDPKIPVESAFTPPAPWYTSPAVARAEMARVFQRTWQVVGIADAVARPGQYLTGSLGTTEYLVSRDANGELRAFHNVCRHHAAIVMSGQGIADQFQCPYHGWTYSLDGRLTMAPRVRGIKDFSARENGLVPIPAVATWGHLVLLNLRRGASAGANEAEDLGQVAGREWLADAEAEVRALGLHSPQFRHVARREYAVSCNWKVYVDNYLDGGYHVPVAHPSLSADLDMESYETQLYERVSIQRARGSASGQPSDSAQAKGSGGSGKPAADVPRVGDSVAYAFVCPNFAINRYGPWLETNNVLPVAVDRCKVIFDWWLDEASGKVGDAQFVEDSLAASSQVQAEDEWLCAQVQRGLNSPAFHVGRYAPSLELGMHQFHRLLHKELSRDE